MERDIFKAGEEVGFVLRKVSSLLIFLSFFAGLTFFVLLAILSAEREILTFTDWKKSSYAGYSRRSLLELCRIKTVGLMFLNWNEGNWRTKKKQWAGLAGDPYLSCAGLILWC